MTDNAPTEETPQDGAKKTQKQLARELTEQLQSMMDIVAPGRGEELGQKMFETIRDYIDARTRRGK